ncbi:hypothetical protein AM587_10010673 [Phytophthora nicotianae]|uniref:Uncharacterized protein n=1 Tax=Phytophthora nicotianae TaxID=4792 RepID=A0A0W8CTM7_PHYNI|nr:hypothetical protein AM587_10010673 [Phytophthora nicotianae]
MSLPRALYRELVTAAKLLDSHASLRALISTDLRESSLAPGSKTRLPHVEAFNRSLLRYLGGRHLYLPDTQRPTLLQLVREEFRKPAGDDDGIDTAFVALRALNDTLAEAKALELPTKKPLETWTLDGVQLAEADFGGQRVPTTNFPTANDPSLFVGVDLDAAARAIYDETAKQTDVVFMSGVSAWSPGQLDSELQQGSWVAVKAPVSLALNARAELWQDLMRTLGGEYAEMSCMPLMKDEE